MTDFVPLNDDEFGRLSDTDQILYLDLLGASLDDWTLTPRQAIADGLADVCDEMLYGGAAGRDDQ